MIASCNFDEVTRNGLDETTVQFADAYGIELTYASSGDVPYDGELALAVLQNRTEDILPFDILRCDRTCYTGHDHLADSWRESCAETVNSCKGVNVLLCRWGDEFDDLNVATATSAAGGGNSLESLFGSSADLLLPLQYCQSCGMCPDVLDHLLGCEKLCLFAYHGCCGTHGPILESLSDRVTNSSDCRQGITLPSRNLNGGGSSRQDPSSCSNRHSSLDDVGSVKLSKPIPKSNRNIFGILLLEDAFADPRLWVSEHIGDNRIPHGMELFGKLILCPGTHIGSPTSFLDISSLKHRDPFIPTWLPWWDDALCIVQISYGGCQNKPYNLVHCARDWNISTALHVSRRINRIQGTCQWIFANQEYLNWREQSDGTLWLSGGPGTGKSILTSTVISRLQDDHRVGEFIVTYCVDVDYRGISPVTAILSRILIKMLLRDPHGKPPSGIQSALSDLIHAGNQVSVARMKNILSVIRHSLRRDETIYLLLDGLDDAGGSSFDQDLIKEFIDHASYPDPNHRIKCFISTRPSFFHDRILTRTMQLAKRVDLDTQSLNKEDLVLYVRDSLRRSSLPRNSQDSKGLEQKLITDASGSFLWVRLMMNTIRYSSGPGAALKVVRELIASSLTIDLDRLYAILLDQISESHRLAALSMLKWVVHAARPLHVRELLQALHLQTGIDLDANNISDISSGLLISTAGQIVRVAHSTVRSFLHGQVKETWEAISLEAHEAIAATCLKSLSSDSLLYSLGLLPENMSIQTRPSDETTFEYARTHWIFHYSVAEIRSDYLTGLLHTHLVKALQQHGCRLNRAQISGLDRLSDVKNHRAHELSFLDIIGTILTVGTRFGFLKLVKLQLEMGADTNFPFGPERLTPLMWASQADNSNVVNVLLQYGADVHLQSTSGATAMVYAISKGQINIAELLLAHGALPLPPEGDSSETFRDLSLTATVSPPCTICGAIEAGYELAASDPIERGPASPIRIATSFIPPASTPVSTSISQGVPGPSHKTKIKWFSGSKMHKALKRAAKHGVEDMQKLLLLAGNDIDLLERSLSMSQLASKLRIA